MTMTKAAPCSWWEVEHAVDDFAKEHGKQCDGCGSTVVGENALASEDDKEFFCAHCFEDKYYNADEERKDYLSIIARVFDALEPESMHADLWRELELAAENI